MSMSNSAPPPMNSPPPDPPFPPPPFPRRLFSPPPPEPPEPPPPPPPPPYRRDDPNLLLNLVSVVPSVYETGALSESLDPADSSPPPSPSPSPPSPAPLLPPAPRWKTPYAELRQQQLAQEASQSTQDVPEERQEQERHSLQPLAPTHTSDAWVPSGRLGPPSRRDAVAGGLAWPWPSANASAAPDASAAPASGNSWLGATSLLDPRAPTPPLQAAGQGPAVALTVPVASTAAASGAAPAAQYAKLLAEVLPKALPVVRDSWNSYQQARAERERAASAEALRERLRQQAEASKPRAPMLRMRPKPPPELLRERAPKPASGESARHSNTLAAGGPMSLGWHRPIANRDIEP